MHFEDLTVWKRAATLSAALYTELNNTREYGYKDQTTRSALSIAGDIEFAYWCRQLNVQDEKSYRKAALA